jgi:hypothetical protein
MLDMAHAISRTVEQISTTKIAATGGSGATVAIVAAMVDTGQVEMWMRMATLSVGLLTGLGSGGLVLMRYIDRWRGRKSDTTLF